MKQEKQELKVMRFAALRTGQVFKLDSDKHTDLFMKSGQKAGLLTCKCGTSYNAINLDPRNPWPVHFCDSTNIRALANSRSIEASDFQDD